MSLQQEITWRRKNVFTAVSLWHCQYSTEHNNTAPMCSDDGSIFESIKAGTHEVPLTYKWYKEGILLLIPKCVHHSYGKKQKNSGTWKLAFSFEELPIHSEQKTKCSLSVILFFGHFTWFWIQHVIHCFAQFSIHFRQHYLLATIIDSLYKECSYTITQ